VAPAAEPLPRSVLVITQSSPASGGAIAMFAAFGSNSNVNSTSRITVYTEHLDLNRFPSPQHRQLVRSYFRDKYRETPIGVVVVDGTLGLDLVLSWRGEMWSEVPIVFYGVDEVSAAQLNLPPNVTGFVAHQTFRGMLDAARALVPGLKRVALVGDPPERDAYRRNYRQEIATLAAEVEFIDLTGRAVTEVKERVAVLPNDAVVFYTAIFVDGAGVVYTPQRALRAISEVTSRPIVIDVESQLGYGAVGGFLFSLSSAAQEAARLAMRIIDGENASQIPVAKIDLNKPIFDGRELKRWNISEDRLPPGSDVRYRPQSLWDQYRWQLSVTIAIVLLQTAMIFWLLFERQRRHHAEMESRDRLLEVIHLNRTAAAGVLSASFSHELNQPLGAILSNAETAEILLKNNPPDLGQITEILADIRRDDQRAAEIIKHLGGLLRKKSQTELQEFDLNDAVRRAFNLLDHEASSRGVVLNVNQVQAALPVRADEVHLQQVILNLALNAMDAMLNCVPGSCKMTMETALSGQTEVEVSVADTGTGIPKDKLKNVFDTFFTTKPQGTGLGLSIARTIIETYGGRIWAENRLGGGAVFRFTLPLAKSQAV